MKKGKFYVVLSLLFISVMFFSENSIGKAIKNPDIPLKVNWDFSTIKLWEVDSAGKEFLVNISCIQMDKKGNVYVMDSQRNRIHKFSVSGKHDVSFSQKGEGPGEIKDAFKFFVLKNRIMVFDDMKISYFNLDGKYKKTIKTNEIFYTYLVLDTDKLLGIPFSALFLKGKTQQRPVYLYNLKNGNKKKLFEVPKLKPLRFSGGGMRLMLKMPDIMNEELFIVKGINEFFYAYSDTLKFQGMNMAGNKTKSFSIEDCKRKKISIKAKKIVLNKATETHRDIPENIIHRMIDYIPDYLPYFHYLFIDDNKFVYMLTSDILNTNCLDVNIFSTLGKYIYRGVIKLEKGYSIIKLDFKNKNLVVFVEDSNGERKLIKYKINTPQL